MRGVLWAPQVVSHQDDVPGIDFRTIAVSVLIYLGAPLAAAVATRYALIALAGPRWFNTRFMPYFGPVALLALVYTVNAQLPASSTRRAQLAAVGAQVALGARHFLWGYVLGWRFRD